MPFVKDFLISSMTTNGFFDYFVAMLRRSLLLQQKSIRYYGNYLNADFSEQNCSAAMITRNTTMKKMQS